MLRPDLAADFAEVDRRKSSTPRAHALLTSVYSAMNGTRCQKKLRDLESLALVLGLHIKFMEDLSYEGEMAYCVHIARVVQTPDGPPQQPVPDEPEPAA